MSYRDLRDFIAGLERDGQLKRISVEVDPKLEMTEICNRVLKQGGPALLFENPRGYTMPVLGNLFGTPHRVALGMGRDSVAELRELGQVLAQLKQPEPPKLPPSEDAADPDAAVAIAKRLPESTLGVTKNRIAVMLNEPPDQFVTEIDPTTKSLQAALGILGADGGFTTKVVTLRVMMEMREVV